MKFGFDASLVVGQGCGVLVFGQKAEDLAGALGPFIIGLMLEANGLIKGGGPGIVQPPAVLAAVQWGVSLVPASFCLIAIPLLLRYRLDAPMLADMRASQNPLRH